MTSPALSIPCLGTTKPFYTGERNTPFLSNPRIILAIKVAGVAATLFIYIGMALRNSLSKVATASVLAKSLPMLIKTCFIIVGLSVFVLVAIVCKGLWEERHPKSNLEEIEALEAAKNLGKGVKISDELKKELEDIVPKIDNLDSDPRIEYVRYHPNNTATFRLKSARDLQFTVSGPKPSSPLGCEERELGNIYENRVYAHAICQEERYTALFVSPIKPIHLKVDGLRRSLLVEEVIQKEDSPDADLENAVRQMVRFLFKTVAAQPTQFLILPAKGNKLALSRFDHLTQNDRGFRVHNIFLSIFGNYNSLLSSLNQKNLIEAAFNEFEQCNIYSLPDWAEPFPNFKARKLQQIGNPLLPREEKPRPQPLGVPNVLGISPENLGLDLKAKDYFFIRDKTIFLDPEWKIITLKEVAQGLIDLINQKLLKDRQANISFTAKEMLITGSEPTFHIFFGNHFYYHTLRGLGYKQSPHRNKQSPYWVELILNKMKEIGIVTEFKREDIEGVTVEINPEKLSSAFYSN